MLTFQFTSSPCSEPPCLWQELQAQHKGIGLPRSCLVLSCVEEPVLATYRRDVVIIQLFADLLGEPMVFGRFLWEPLQFLRNFKSCEVWPRMLKLLFFVRNKMSWCLKSMCRPSSSQGYEFRKSRPATVEMHRVGEGIKQHVLHQ